MNSIIPSNNSVLQHTLSKLTEQDLAALDWRVILRSRHPQECDSAFLPFLAWENSISDAEGWQFAETEQAQRDLIERYITLHQGKGTPRVIRQLFRDLRLGEIEIIERAGDLSWDGTANFDGKYIFNGDIANGWAYYGIVLTRVITVAQAELIKQILHEITPARCQLLYLDYRSHALLWNGEINFDGTYTFGANT